MTPSPSGFRARHRWRTPMTRSRQDFFAIRRNPSARTTPRDPRADHARQRHLDNFVEFGSAFM